MIDVANEIPTKILRTLLRSHFLVQAGKEQLGTLGETRAALEDQMTAYKVKAHWDANDRVWWAECPENHGIIAEAASIEFLLEAIQKAFPGLTDLDLQLGPEDVGASIRLAVDGSTWAPRTSPLHAT
jgi:predicted RNase H-like HicB family nuclease